MKLYISDLDGTLLNNDAVLSSNTVSIINSLIEKGLNFTVATARSLHTAQKILAPLNLKLPIVLFNGVYVYDLLNKKYLASNILAHSIFKEIIEISTASNLFPFVYTVNKENEHCVYYKELNNSAAEEFIKSNISFADGRKFIKVSSYEECCGCDIATVNLLAERDK